ncbi:MAG: leucine-rich repeat domain-containing protein [Clostridiales bacterium]|nr:leucine-rich repeat domain-containing protein [Clostridiales bacterium]
MSSIGEEAFRDTGIWNNTSDNSVAYADKWVVGYKGTITNAVLRDDTVGVGDRAFANCSSLESIEIPSSVESIGQSVFRNCNSLVSIEVSVGNANYSSIDGVLFNKAITELILYPAGKEGNSYVIPSSVTGIGAYAFYYCTSLTSIEIPTGVTSIGTYAFYWCYNLESITIPNSVIDIGYRVFEGCHNLTIYTEVIAAAKPNGWVDNWNGDCPVVWGDE